MSRYSNKQIKILEEKFKEFISTYDFLLKRIEGDAKVSEDRAYGGMVRAAKGLLVETITHRLVETAWLIQGKDMERMSFKSKAIKIPIKIEYVNKISDKAVKKYILDNIDDYYYKYPPDVPVYIDDNLVLLIECKAYTENAMFKRILVDFSLVKSVCPNCELALLQLESQLGGDFSSSLIAKKGSTSTHTLLSYFDVDINILTLLEGERKVNEPINKEEFYKPLIKERLYDAVSFFVDILKQY